MLPLERYNIPYKLKRWQCHLRFFTKPSFFSLFPPYLSLTISWKNSDILFQDEIFDTQKGIIRKIDIKKLGKEKIKINNTELLADKYLLDASKNPKDKGPFPQYTIWYSENGELIKFQFKNWKDKKIIITRRSNWGD